jgi:alpha-glucosidase (family GH31 glycosyl hydrolase)
MDGGTMMREFVSRREVVRRFGKATAGLALTGGVIRGQDTDIVVASNPVEIAISSVSPATVRITVIPRSRSAAFPDTGTLVAEGQGRSVGRGRSAGALSAVKAGNLVVRFKADPPALHVDTASGQPVQILTFDSVTPGVSFLLPKGPLLGLGEGGPQFDRKGQTFADRSGQGGYRLATHGGRVPIQWLIGTDGWAMFVHRPLGAFDLTGTEGKLQPTGDALPLDIFVVSSREPAAIMKEYARITGHPEMTALWTLGYQQSHRTLDGFESVKSVAQNFRDKKLPCDALIYLGTGFTPSGWNVKQSTTGFSSENTEFTFHPKNFPNPKAHIDQLHSMHFRVVLHIVIESDNGQFAGTVKDECPRAVQPDVLPVSCYWPYHKGVFDLGIDGWWPDQGDGFDEPSRRLRHRMYWEGSQLWRPNERPYVLHRNGAAGMARYAAFLWSGDVQNRWETLKNHVPSGINTGLSGIPYWGFDIGGFIPTAEYTGEMFVRWFQYGAFCPLFRSHGRNWYLHLPWGWNTGDPGPQETANYTTDPKELRNPEVEPICKKYLELRYRMLPYIYTAMRETHETGLPMIRALWLHYPEDVAAVGRSDEYLWGRDILVAPVTEKGATVRKLYLPRGTWYDFWTEEKVEGGREIERKVDLATIPLYVRAGAVLPLGPVKQYSSEPVDGPLSLVVYPGTNGTTSLYEDDGKTFNYRVGEFMKIQMNWTDSIRSLNLRLAAGSRMLPPNRRPIAVRVAGQTAARTETFTGRPLEIRF